MSGRGKLSFKGDKKSKKKSSKSKHKLSTHDDATNIESKQTEALIKKQQQDDPTIDSDEELTPAERRSKKFKAQQARREMEKVVKLSHRERVEEFNEKLGKLTELNDIPRVSAAGNG